MHRLLFAALIGALLATAAAHAGTVRVVAAESVYGDLARQIGGSGVAVTSVLSRPNQDPHAFEPGASTARLVADANLVIFNGAGYDPWMPRLLSASRAPSRRVIEVARLAGKGADDNPHVWYKPEAISLLARALADALSTLDPPNRARYAARLAAFEGSMQPLTERIARLRAMYAGSPVGATEPVFGYMADALGLDMRERRFQLSVMNGTEPSARDIAALERDLRTRSIRVLIHNAQTGSAITERMRAVAAQAGVPVVGVTETLPPGMHYQQWMSSQLDALARALGGR